VSGRTGPAGAGLVAFLCLIVSGCTGTDGSDDPSFRPHFEEVACPDDVEIQVLPEHACGYLTVLENRAKSNGRTIRLFVLKVLPPEQDHPDDPVFTLGGNIGEAAEIGGSTPVAARLHRIAYLIDPRGTGHSRPRLDCPEVDALDDDVATALASDAEVRSEFVAAVKACHDRLVSEGVDVAAYDVEQAAADVEDLRRALGVPTWNLGSLGTYSRVLLEVMRSSPEHVRSVYLDSPEFPQLPDPEEAVIGTHWALQQLSDVCRAAPRCRHVLPDVTLALSRATSGLDAHPASFVSKDGAIATGVGAPLTVGVDGGKLLRIVRSSLGLTQTIPWVPSMIAAAADGRIIPPAREILENDPAFCSGYRPGEGCSGPDFSLGVYLTVLCRDEVPFVDRAALTDSFRGDPAYETVFGSNPYVEACTVWDVPPGGAVMGEPVTADIPVLILIGQFDPHSPTAVAEEAATGLSNAYVVEVPAQGHNVLGTGDCAVSIRNAWVEHPGSPPEGTSCLETLSVSFAVGMG
jgi:pimeloyl-ACP methyl ester carboxylesterase